jgi:hypothetical protein
MSSTRPVLFLGVTRSPDPGCVIAAFPGDHVAERRRAANPITGRAPRWGGIPVAA